MIPFGLDDRGEMLRRMVREILLGLDRVVALTEEVDVELGLALAAGIHLRMPGGGTACGAAVGAGSSSEAQWTTCPACRRWLDARPRRAP